MEFRTRFSHHDPYLYGFNQSGQESMTRQSEKDEADINVVMERFMRTGQLPLTKNPVFQQAQFGNASAPQYDQALMIVKQAKEAFSQLPADLRHEFHNDPYKLQKFLLDPKNDQRAVELGLKENREPSEKQLLTEMVKNTKKEPAAPPLETKK